uniref:hypothetical protein n=1 Tax=Alloprevotella sp. TaxID=1872471 RepID=UPI003FF0E7FA
GKGMLLAEVGISVLIICKFSNKWTCTRKKEVEGLSCGFEGGYNFYSQLKTVTLRQTQQIIEVWRI